MDLTRSEHCVYLCKDMNDKSLTTNGIQVEYNYKYYSHKYPMILSIDH